MTEKTPDFVTRVQKFLPETEKILRSFSEDYFGIYFRKNQSEGIEQFGGRITSARLVGKYGNRDWDVTLLGHLNGSPIKWIKNGNWWQLSDEDNKRLMSEIKYHGCRFENFLGVQEWRNCHKYYSQKYEAEKKEFEAQNPVWQQLKALDSPEVKASMSEDEQKAMRNLYEAKLKKDPDYQDLQDLKKDVFDLAAYVKYLEKQEKKDKREGLKKRLGELKTEYDSTDIKETLPDEKRRLAIRGAMHKKLKKESGL